MSIQGTIIDAKTKEPLIGAAVIELGTNNGGYTDYSGEFIIDLSDTAKIIEVSYIGYLTKKIAVSKSQTEYSIELETDAVITETVTITVPYGKQTKRTFTGSVSQVKSEQIANTTETSFDKALQGQVPGVVLSSSSGQPGSSTEIQLRGVGSISAGSSPLFVIDGVPIFSGDMTQTGANSNILSTINPQDIESISVLKDASATSMYGSRASNGVIMIKTKSGKKGDTYTFSTSHGIGQIVTNNFNVLSAKDYRTIQAEAMRNAGMTEAEIERALIADTANTDWFKEVYTPSYSQSYEFVAQGGRDSLRYFLSTAYKNDKGIVETTDLSRMSLRLNIEQKPTKRITYGIRLNPSYTKQNLIADPGVFSSPVTGTFIAAPTEPIYLEDGKTYNYTNGFYNPIGCMNQNKNEQKNIRILANAYLEIDILKNLQFKTLTNIDNIRIEEYTYLHPETPDGSLVKGIGESYSSERTAWTSSSTLNWDGHINREHNFSALGGFEAEYAQMSSSNFKASKLPYAGIESLQAAAKLEQINTYLPEEEAMLSVFTQGQYNFKAKYFLSASFRVDGSSKFPGDKRWAPFWSVGGSWNINNENFMRNVSSISLLKLRVSYGTSGNATIPNYAYFQTYNFGENYDGNPGSVPSQIGTEDLTWEKNNNLNIGLDVELLKRITASIEVYNRKTFDLLMAVPRPAYLGYTEQLKNVGELTNKGIELSLQTNNITKENFTWTSTLTFAMNRNTVDELYTEGVQDTIIQGTKIRSEGQAFNSFYLPYWAGVNSADGSAMWYDSEGNPTKNYNEAEYVLAGSTDPKFTAGFNNTLKYKNLTFSFMLYGNYGNLVYNQLNMDLVSDGAIMGKNQSSEILDRWQKPGDQTDVPKVVQNNGSSSNEFSTRYLEDGSYLRLKNICLYYAIPSEVLKKAKLKTIELGIQVHNVFVLSNFSGMDPETRSNGIYFYDYPKQRTYTASLKITL